MKKLRVTINLLRRIQNNGKYWSVYTSITLKALSSMMVGHQESSNQQRIWNFSWPSPDDNTTMAKLLVYGNAVNGNQQQTGDNWNELRSISQVSKTSTRYPRKQRSSMNWKPLTELCCFWTYCLLYICYRIIKD